MNRTSHDQPAPSVSLTVFLGALALIMVLAAGLRLLAIGSDDYWLDELHSQMNSGGRYAASYALPHGEILYDLERPTDLAAGAGVADARRVRLDRLRRQLTTVSKRRRSRGGRVVKWTVDRLHR